MSAPTTLYDKIFDDHVVDRQPDGTCLLYIDRHLVHEVTSPQAFEGLRMTNRKVRAPEKTLAVVDHNVPTSDRSKGIAEEESRIQVETLAKNAADFGVEYYSERDKRQGIVHVIGPEQGFTLPGTTIVCGDSHTSTHGAFGALAHGIGTSEVEHVLATQTLVYRVAQTMRITIDGALPYGTSSKDVVIWLISQIGAQGARGYAVEFSGSTIASLSAEARMTLCNMTVEAGARAALIAPDQTTFDYVRAHTPSLDQAAWQNALDDWRNLYSDADASFDAEYRFDAHDIAPFVTWGTSPDQAVAIDQPIPDESMQATPEAAASLRRALDYMGLSARQALAGTHIDRVFIGSCTNGRIEDLRTVAALVRGKHVADGVRAMVVPGSGSVRRIAEQEGIAQTLIDAGFEWREPGCSMCLAMNDDVLEAG